MSHLLLWLIEHESHDATQRQRKNKITIEMQKKWATEYALCIGDRYDVCYMQWNSIPFGWYIVSLRRCVADKTLLTSRWISRVMQMKMNGRACKFEYCNHFHNSQTSNRLGIRYDVHQIEVRPVKCDMMRPNCFFIAHKFLPQLTQWLHKQFII